MVSVLKWKDPLLLLGGIGISTIGGWVYLIAINLIVLHETGSPLAMALLYILGPIAAVCSNAWAGSYIDRMNTRTLMIYLDVFRAIGILLIPFVPSLIYVYMLALIIHMASAIFEPASMVYMTKLIPKVDRQRFNALRSFIQSSGTIIGPSVAGVLFIVGTPYTAIYVNATALVGSAFIIRLLPNVDPLLGQGSSPKVTWSMIKNDMKTVVTFCRSSSYVAKIYLLGCGVTIFMTAIDSLEAAFAKEVLLMTDTAYGFFLAVFGAGIITGSIINSIFAKSLRVKFLIGFGTPAAAIGYFALYSSTHFYHAAVGCFLIGAAITFSNTGFLTFYQNHVPVEMMGRFGSILGIIEAVFIVILTLTIGIAAEFTSIRPVGLIASLGFFMLAVITLSSVMKQKYESYFSKGEGENGEVIRHSV
ncbi:MFS transporter [Alkalihalophilus marmarensis]|uniref:MFS transporter n=1 Tax=Alkalihalophilus marmarensis TaxID=521377 RepID=UPI00399CD47D